MEFPSFQSRKSVPCVVESFSYGVTVLVSPGPSRLTLYTESLGTLPATHYDKYCHNCRKGCKPVHFNGYKLGDGLIHYSDDCLSLPYLLSTQETGVETAMLKHFDVKLLVGQISYMQKAASLRDTTQPRRNALPLRKKKSHANSQHMGMHV